MAKTRDLALAGLTQQVEPHRALRPQALGLHLLALQFEPPRITIERFLERRDDDAGKAGFETAWDVFRRLDAAGVVRRAQLRDAATARDVGEANHRIEHS